MNDSTLTDNRRHSFFIIDNDVIDTHGERLGPYGIAVYCLLVRHASRAGTCFPSYSTIASKLNISRPKAIEMVKLLIELGLVGKTSRENDKGEATSNEYSILQVVNTVNHPSKPDLPPVVNDVNPKKTNPKQDTFKEEEKPCAAAQTPAPLPSKKEPKPKKQKEPPHPATSAILAAFTLAKEATEPGCIIHYAAEGVAAKQLAEKGWTPEQVEECVYLMKKDKWWINKTIHLATVADKIAALLKGKTHAEDSDSDQWIQTLDLPDVDITAPGWVFGQPRQLG